MHVYSEGFPIIVNGVDSQDVVDRIVPLLPVKCTLDCNLRNILEIQARGREGIIRQKWEKRDKSSFVHLIFLASSLAYTEDEEFCSISWNGTDL